MIFEGRGDHLVAQKSCFKLFSFENDVNLTINRVKKNSEACNAGLSVGDKIIALDNFMIYNKNDIYYSLK